MSSIMKKPKFPKFMSLLYSRGLDIKEFTKILIDSGYHQYNYNNVRKKLRGDSSLDFEDIVVFSRVMNVKESIFFNNQYTKCIPNMNIS
ncbi:hypothetical protein [Viridibacillus arvi]|uniref:hypothetical protein n=1 Tax=Viridibacillus arvi TaxID=263475 RepID=UPI003D2B3BEA